MRLKQAILSIFVNKISNMKLSKYAFFIGFFAVLVVIYFFKINDSQGEANAYCDKFDKTSIDNGSGMTISHHSTACTILGTSVIKYIYLHPTNLQPSKEHLIFRYSEIGGDDSFKVRWLNTNAISIQVDRVGQVSKLETEIGAVYISYKIGNQGFIQ
jgi:hypothetical protein